MKRIHCRGYGATGSLLSQLRPITFERMPPKEDELLIKILYCGVCHSDLHQVRNEWNNTKYPCIPGHEIIGRVERCGKRATRFRAGDIVGVGCMVDSCGECESCREHLEQYCEGPVSWTATYNGYAKPDGSDFNTFGGYSSCIVVKESFVLRIPPALELSAAAPILCAGITTYSPLKFWKVKPGDKVAVIGLGGVGHMGVKIARAMGALVTVITTSGSKKSDALRIGAADVFLETDEEEMEAHEREFDLILDTIPEKHDVTPFIRLLKRDGVLVVIGLLDVYKRPIDNMDLAAYRRSVAGSMIGGIKETQEVLDFCAEHNIQPEVELISIHEINKAFERMEASEIRFRFVIDLFSLEEEEGEAE